MLLYWILLPIVWVLAHIVWRIEVVGRENLKKVRDGRPFVIAANHISNMDPVFLVLTVFSWRRMYIPAKKELFQNPLAGWFLRCMGAVSIDRGKGDTLTLEKVTDACKNGTGVLIFPEGTRTKTGKLGVLKSGAFVIAGSAGADMVPCRIIYGSKTGRQRLFCRVRVVFGEPIPAADLQITDPTHKIASLRRMKNRLRDELEALLAANAFESRSAAAEKDGPAVDVEYRDASDKKDKTKTESAAKTETPETPAEPAPDAAPGDAALTVPTLTLDAAAAVTLDTAAPEAPNEAANKSAN